VHLKATKETFVAGEPIFVTLQVVNTGTNRAAVNLGERLLENILISALPERVEHKSSRLLEGGIYARTGSVAIPPGEKYETLLYVGDWLPLGVSGETILPENRQFEIPFASACMFFKFQPKSLLPSSTDGRRKGSKPTDAKSVPGFFGNFKLPPEGNFTPPSTLGVGKHKLRVKIKSGTDEYSALTDITVTPGTEEALARALKQSVLKVSGDLYTMENEPYIRGLNDACKQPTGKQTLLRLKEEMQQKQDLRAIEFILEGYKGKIYD
jgi:hypothetical protein